MTEPLDIIITSHWEGGRWSGTIELPDDARPLEYIFRFFNRIEDGDADRLDAIGYRLPSLSVGDVVEIAGERWRCAMLGWERLR
jgi:hypothetical protein